MVVCRVAAWVVWNRSNRRELPGSKEKREISRKPVRPIKLWTKLEPRRVLVQVSKPLPWWIVCCYVVACACFNNSSRDLGRLVLVWKIYIEGKNWTEKVMLRKKPRENFGIVPAESIPKELRFAWCKSVWLSPYISWALVEGGENWGRALRQQNRALRRRRMLEGSRELWIWNGVAPMYAIWLFRHS